MIIKKDKSHIQSGLHKDNFTDTNDEYLFIDENTEDGEIMTKLIFNNYPFVDFEHDGGFVTQVIVLDKPERPEEVDGKEVVLEQNEQGVWGYTYKDKPLSELELLRQQVEQQQQLIDAMLGVE